MADFKVDSCEEVERKIVKLEPKEEWTSGDEDAKIKVEEEDINEEIKVEWQLSPLEGTKWFQCEKCDYKSKRKSGLKRHVISKHLGENEISWFECEKCDYRSKRRHTLKRHTTSEHVVPGHIKWFKCEKCSFVSKNSENVKQHTIKKHPNQ